MFGYCLLVVLLLIALKWLKYLPWVTGLHKKCVVVTGCDSGFGSAVAKSLYNKGVYVFAGCLTESGASKLSEETGERLKTFLLDVRKPESISKAYAYVRDNLPKDTVLWGLVNNAGVTGLFAPMEFITRADFMEVMNINCFGMIDVAREFMPLLKRSRGRIVNLISMAGEAATPAMSPYTASKFAMKGFSDSLRVEKAMWGIKVSSIHPAFFRTNILMNLGGIKQIHRERWPTLDPALKEEYGPDYIDLFLDEMQKVFDTASTNIMLVVNDIEHGLFARWPNVTYYPGIQAKVISSINRYLPHFVWDRIAIADFSKVTPKALQ